ncbi:hypothetical protein [Pseudoteredinibacter isoporae]|nr:hypothetical protein [Pseudoteredinibacter isoporae]
MAIKSKVIGELVFLPKKTREFILFSQDNSLAITEKVIFSS